MWHVCSTLTLGMQSPALTILSIYCTYSQALPPKKLSIFIFCQGEGRAWERGYLSIYCTQGLLSPYAEISTGRKCSEMHLNKFCVCFIAACKLKSKYAYTDKQNTLNTCASMVLLQSQHLAATHYVPPEFQYQRNILSIRKEAIPGGFFDPKHSRVSFTSTLLEGIVRVGGCLLRAMAAQGGLWVQFLAANCWPCTVSVHYYTHNINSYYAGIYCVQLHTPLMFDLSGIW